MKIENFDLINNLPYYENKILKVYKNSQGYSRVFIENKFYKLHRLIAIKYIKNINNYPVVDHIDNNKLNNNINNLQWLNYSANSKKAYLQNNKMSNFHIKKYKKIIISEKENIIVEHKSLRDCAKFINRNVAGVYRVLQGEWNLCNGYKLRYKL